MDLPNATESRDSNLRRKRKRNNTALFRRRLKDDAYPQCLTSPTRVFDEASSPSSSSESRRLNEEVLGVEEITRDQFHSIEELVAKLNKSRFPQDVTEILAKNYVYVCVLDKPKVVK